MKIKPGVRVHGVRPEIAFVMPAIWEVFDDAGAELVVTSVTDGRHSRASLHYQGAAVDLRSRDLSGSAQMEVVVALNEALGDDFDVVRETDHIHVEYQPKAPY